jgi:hypothetical protein
VRPARRGRGWLHRVKASEVKSCHFFA